MVHAGKIPLAAALNGETEAAMMDRLIREHKTPHKAAVALGVYPNSVRQWLLRNGYVFTGKSWEKQTQPEHTAN